MVVGSALMGWVADIYGAKTSLIVALAGDVIFFLLSGGLITGTWET